MEAIFLQTKHVVTDLSAVSGHSKYDIGSFIMRRNGPVGLIYPQGP
jgi:hypothetical protein